MLPRFIIRPLWFIPVLALNVAALVYFWEEATPGSMLVLEVYVGMAILVFSVARMQLLESVDSLVEEFIVPRRVKFFLVFGWKPSQEKVDSKLAVRAARMHLLFAGEVNFRNQNSPHAGTRFLPDSDPVIRAQRELLERYKDEFWHAYNLGIRQGYTMRERYTDYIRYTVYIPSLQ